jgi:hypothetical protein
LLVAADRGEPEKETLTVNQGQYLLLRVGVAVQVELE